MRLFFLLWFSSLMAFDARSVQAQEYRVDLIKNCQLEMRIVTFLSQVQFFKHCVEGKSDIRSQKILQFASSYFVDTALLQQQIEKIRKVLPGDFFKMKFTGSLYEGPKGDFYDNTPDEKAIWFEEVFSKKEVTGGYTMYAAFQITFDGYDARFTEQRMSPKIIDIQFILDQQELKKIADRLKKLPPSQ